MTFEEIFNPTALNKSLSIGDGGSLINGII